MPGPEFGPEAHRPADGVAEPGTSSGRLRASAPDAAPGGQRPCAHLRQHAASAAHCCFRYLARLRAVFLSVSMESSVWPKLFGGLFAEL